MKGTAMEPLRFRPTRHAGAIAVAVLIGLIMLAGSVTGRQPESGSRGLVAPAFHLEQELGGHSRPLYLTSSNSKDRIFIVEQTGRIKVARMENGEWVKRGTFLDLTTLVNDPNAAGNGERGLLGLAFHPDYGSNRKF